MKRPVCGSLSLDKPQPVRSGSSSEQALQRSLPDGSESSLAPLFLLSKANPLRWALLWYRGDARLRPEWRQGIRKDRAANPVFSDITFKRRGRLLPSAAGPLPPPSGREAQSLRRCAPPPFTQGRHGSRPLRQLCCHLPRGGRHNPSVSLAADSSLCTREPLRRGGGASRIIFQAGGGCGVLRTSDRPAEGFLRRISH